MTWVQFLNGVKLVWIQFSFSLTGCLTKTIELSLPYYLDIAGGWRDGFMPFPSALEQSKTQTAISRIWTWVASSIFYTDCHTYQGSFRVAVDSLQASQSW